MWHSRIVFRPLRSLLFYGGLCLVVVFASLPMNAQAIACDSDFYSSNDILFFDPCSGGAACTTETGTLDGPAPTQLTGKDNEEKTWNYLIGRGMTPIGAAGVMGNLEQEAGFNPFLTEVGGYGGYGIIQWTFERRTNLESAAAAAGVSISPGSDNDPALLFQLNYLWDIEYGKMTWQAGTNAETKVEGDTTVNKLNAEANVGNGSTLYFHAAVERSGDSPSMLQERIDSAKSFLEKYGEGGAATGCSSGVSEGGLTEEQAKKFMMNYGKNPNGFSAEKSGVLWNMCNGGGSNCVTFSYFFNNAFTDLPAEPGDGNGNQIVGSLVSKGAQGGSTPQVFSTFSWDDDDGLGHTGIVLGIHGSTIIVGHASCISSGIGEGDGTKAGGGAGWVEVGDINSNAAYLGTTPSGFAYPNNVDTAAIEAFLNM